MLEHYTSCNVRVRTSKEVTNIDDRGNCTGPGSSPWWGWGELTWNAQLCKEEGKPLPKFEVGGSVCDYRQKWSDLGREEQEKHNILTPNSQNSMNYGIWIFTRHLRYSSSFPKSVSTLFVFMLWSQCTQWSMAFSSHSCNSKCWLVFTYTHTHTHTHTHTPLLLTDRHLLPERNSADSIAKKALVFSYN